MITMYRVFLVLLTAVSALMMPEAMRLPKDAQYSIGPGFVPFVMLSICIVTCVLLLLFDLRKKANYTIEKAAAIRLVLYLVSTMLLIFCMEHVGITISVIVYIFATLVFIEKVKWTKALKVAVITGVSIYLLFHTWLKVPMTIINGVL